VVPKIKKKIFRFEEELAMHEFGQDVRLQDTPYQIKAKMAKNSRTRVTPLTIPSLLSTPYK
jgi:hypothetical protein